MLLFTIIAGVLGGIAGGYVGNQFSEVLFQKEIKRPLLYGGLFGVLASASELRQSGSVVMAGGFALVMGIILMLLIGFFKKQRGRD